MEILRNGIYVESRLKNTYIVKPGFKGEQIYLGSFPRTTIGLKKANDRLDKFREDHNIPEFTTRTRGKDDKKKIIEYFKSNNDNRDKIIARALGYPRAFVSSTLAEYWREKIKKIDNKISV